MNKLVVANIIRFVVLIIVQTLILNKMSFYGFLTPYLYVMFILLLPFETKGWALLLLAFLLGITIDFLSGTLGLHASASVFTGFVRPLFIKLNQKQDYGGPSQPTIAEMGVRWFVPYSFLMILIHHTALNLLDTFNIKDIFFTLLRTVISTSVTFIIALSLQYITSRNINK